MHPLPKISNAPINLRFGIICDGYRMPAALARSVSELLSIPKIQLGLLIIDAAPARAIGTNAHWLTGWVWKLYERICVRDRASCLQPVDMSQVLMGTPKIYCSNDPNATHPKRFSPTDVAAIREHDLDFILRVSASDTYPDSLQLARFGVWSFRFGATAPSDTTPPAFWEFYDREAVTPAVLERETGERGESIPLLRCFTQTNKLSYAQNLNSLSWATTYMPARVCTDILNGCAQYINALPVRIKLQDRAPSNGAVLILLLGIAAAWMKRQFESLLFSEDWNVGLVRRPIHEFLDPEFRPRIEWLNYKKANHYVADPFLLKTGGKLKLMAEEFDWRANRGYIVESVLNEGAESKGRFIKILDEGIHMSYPYLFEFEGRHYCLPEASARKDAWLYAYDPDSTTLRPQKILLHNFRAVDPTIFEYQGRWWLFCAHAEDEVQSKLFLWYASNPLGPWEWHPANPVKMDVRSSRPAGRPFLHEGNLYRPSQDCSLTYGGAITINRVNDLTTKIFSEEAVAHISPAKNGRYKDGIHTITTDGFTTAIDGKGVLFAPNFLWHRIKHKLAKLARAT